ncbi:MAG: YbhB/YbcL family Raf kinase inhibitor-like protein [Gemmatimonadaceae bacterium]
MSPTVKGNSIKTRARVALGALMLVASALAVDAITAQATTSPPVQPPAGRGGGGGGAARGGGGAARGGIRVMTLTSSAFADGGVIPMKHAQQGRDVSPPLAWSGQPDSTRSFVLIMHDADAAIGDGNDDMLHWMVWNIPGSVSSLPEGVNEGPMDAMTPAPNGGARGAANNLPRQISGTGPYYRGPAAPATGPSHHYVFELYALDANVNVAAVGLAVPATRAAVVAAMATHIRGKGVLVGLYRRSAP